MCVLHPIIHMIILMDTFVRGCFMLVGSFSAVTQELINGVLDIDWNKKVVEIPNLSTCATVVARTILRITNCFVQAALGWTVKPMFDMAMGALFRLVLQPMGRVFIPGLFVLFHMITLVDTFVKGCFMLVGACSTGIQELISGVQDIDLKKIFEIPDLSTCATFAARTVLRISTVFVRACANAFLSLAWSTFRRFVKPMFSMAVRIIIRLVRQAAMKILMASIIMSFEAFLAALRFIIKPMFVLEMRAIFRLVLQPAMKILMALILMSFEAFRWIFMAMPAIFGLVLIQPMKRVFTVGRFVLFHRQRDDLDNSIEEEDEATDGDSVGTTETSSESFSDSLEENDPVVAALVESFGSLSL